MLRSTIISRSSRRPFRVNFIAFTGVKYESTTIIRQPSPLALREAPTPLVFAYAKAWYENESKAWYTESFITLLHVY